MRGCGDAAVQVAGCSGARCREVQRCRAVRGCGDTEACRGGAVQQGGGAARHFPRRRRATTRRARAPARRPPAALPAGCATPRAPAACMGQRAVASTLEAGSSSTPGAAAAISTSGPASPHGSRAARRALRRGAGEKSMDYGHAALQLRVLLHLVARGARQPAAVRWHGRGSRIGPGAAGRRVERRVEAAAARLWRRWRWRWLRRPERGRWRGRRAVGAGRDRHLDQEYAPFQHTRRDDRLEARALWRRELDLHAGPHARRHFDADSLHAWRWRSRGLRRRSLAARAAQARRARPVGRRRRLAEKAHRQTCCQARRRPRVGETAARCARQLTPTADPWLSAWKDKSLQPYQLRHGTPMLAGSPCAAAHCSKTHPLAYTRLYPLDPRGEPSCVDADEVGEATRSALVLFPAS